jgi:ankyrin repeat protein
MQMLVQILAIAFSLVLAFVLVGCSKSAPIQALIDAASDGNANKVAQLIENGEPVDGMNQNGETALDWSIYRCHLDVVEKLIDLKADVNHTDQMGFTPLMYTATELRGKGYDSSTAQIRDRIATVLIQHGAEVNRVGQNGDTALHFAVGDRNPELVRILLAAGADKNAKNNQGYTPISLAKSWGYNNVVDALDGK